MSHKMIQYRIDKSDTNDSIHILIQYNAHIVNSDVESVKHCI